MSRKARITTLTLASLALAAGAMVADVGTSNATTVRPNWIQKTCPANAWAPGDIHCYEASDPLSWVRFHVYFDPIAGHDRSWANGYVGQSNLHGNICVVDSLSGAFQCVGENGGTGRGVQTASIPDGPANLDFGELDFYDASDNLVALYHTQGF